MTTYIKCNKCYSNQEKLKAKDQRIEALELEDRASEEVIRVLHLEMDNQDQRIKELEGEINTDIGMLKMMVERDSHYLTEIGLELIKKRIDKLENNPSVNKQK